MTRPGGRAILVLLLLTPAAPAASAGSGVDEARLGAAIAGDHREAKNRARDRWRHPAETLAFFGIRPDMTVLEIWPGGGWYTEILAPYLKGTGRYYAATWDHDSKGERVQRWIKRYRDKLAGRPDVYGDVVVTEIDRKKTRPVAPGTADAVLTFRNVHNWMKRGFDKIMFRTMFEALKPGGILGVVEHRADPDAFPDPQAESGYVQEEQVIDLAKEAGFRLVGRSEINANPKDTRDHPKGVWTLPPSLRLKDQDRDKYLAIGESDRMTLKFVKPAQ